MKVSKLISKANEMARRAHSEAENRIASRQAQVDEIPKNHTFTVTVEGGDQKTAMSALNYALEFMMYRMGEDHTMVAEDANLDPDMLSQVRNMTVVS